MDAFGIGTPEIEAALSRDDYASVGKPAIDWDDEHARAALVDELVCDALRALEVLKGRELHGDLADAADLLATVTGQDVEHGDDGHFRIRRGVAKDRVVSVVDPTPATDANRATATSTATKPTSRLTP